MANIADLKTQIMAEIDARAKELISYVEQNATAAHALDILSIVNDLKPVEEMAVSMYPKLAPIISVAATVEGVISQLVTAVEGMK